MGYAACSVHPPLACFLAAVDKGRVSKSAEVQRVWEVHDERLQFMSRRDASLLDESLGRDDVSLAWLVWSRAAEAALADAFRFSGGPLPSRGLVLGRGSTLLRVVQLGGHRVRKARANVADALDAADVFLYCDSSVAPLLDMRRRFKAVLDVLDAMIRYGVSLSRSVELTVQWDKILDDLSLDRGLGIGAFFHAASGVHRRLCDSGVGVISMKGAPLALPTFATAQFKSFFDCGRAVRCMSPLGAGQFMHLVVLYGYQGADADPEQVALTDHLFDAALGELSVV